MSILNYSEDKQIMATDDPRLSKLITSGSNGDIVIVGSPYDFLRKRSHTKGGQDNGPCCLRRFYPKVGTLINPEYQIDITGLKVSDLGNFVIEVSKEEEDEQFVNVTSKRFKGEFVNYYKSSPELIIDKMSNTLVNLVKNNQLPFVFGGSKQGLVASVAAFHKAEPENKHKNVYILSGRPCLQRLYDGDKPTSDNISIFFSQKYPASNFTYFGVDMKYLPSEYKNLSEGQITIKKQKFPNFMFVGYSQIRSFKMKKQKAIFGFRTQGAHKFKQIYDSTEAAQVNVSLEVLELFTGCRDLSVAGLQFDQFLEIMMFLGRQQNVKIVSFSQFNPSCQDYESSLLILNAFYYFLLGRASRNSTNKC